MVRFLFLSFIISIVSSVWGDDLKQMHKILLICEEINTAYNSKDIEYLEDLFGGDRLVLEMVANQDSVTKLRNIH